MQTASVIKLAILYEALEQLRQGKMHWEDQITLNKADQVPGSGVLLFLDTPLPLTLKDVLTMMIVMSDNTAANLAMDKIGIPNVNRRLEMLGLKDTYLYKKVFTPNPPGWCQPHQHQLLLRNGDIYGTATSSSFGTILASTASYRDPRIMQFGLRLDF